MRRSARVPLQLLSAAAAFALPSADHHTQAMSPPNAASAVAASTIERGGFGLDSDEWFYLLGSAAFVLWFAFVASKSGGE